MTILLPVDTQDLKITITIPKEISPYLTEWYNKAKKQGDTPSSFVVRILKNMALVERVQLKNGEYFAQMRTQEEANNTEIRELSTLMEQ